jgi:hypothetical protein
MIMSSITTCSIMFACVFGGAVLGMFLRGVLPQSHLSDDSKNAVTMTMTLVATMSALVLSLLISSAKNSYDAQSAELTEFSAKVVLLDRVLANYGPDTTEPRNLLRSAVAGALERIWSKERSGASQLAPQVAATESLLDSIEKLSPEDDNHRSLQTRARNIAFDLRLTRWLMYEQGTSSISLVFFTVLVFWLAALFMSFGLFAPPNAVVVASFLIAALAVSGAVLLIVEMYTPYVGLIQVSSAPLRAALAHLGK